MELYGFTSAGLAESQTNAAQDRFETWREGRHQPGGSSEWSREGGDNCTE
jgi:hypothetical protein